MEGLFFGGMLAMMLVPMLIIGVLGIIYLVGVYKYLKAVGKDTPISVFIPFWGAYTFANTVDPDEAGDIHIIGTVKIQQKLFRFYWVVAAVVAVVPVIGGIASMVVNYAGLYVIIRRAFAKMDNKPEEDVSVEAIISTILPFLFAFKVFKKAGNIKNQNQNQNQIGML